MEEGSLDSKGNKHGANGLAYMYYLVCERCGDTYAVEPDGSMSMAFKRRKDYRGEEDVTRWKATTFSFAFSRFAGCTHNT